MFLEDSVNSYKDLIVWQKSMDLVEIIYSITKRFPEEEKFYLVSQMRRASVSIPSNIAEGKLRKTKKDFVKFLRIAYSSGAELETQIEISKRIIDIDIDYKEAEGLLEEVMRMLNKMVNTF